MSEWISDGMEHVEALAAIGKRPTGFEGERKAAEYLCAQLEEWGLTGVGTEEFAARSWDFETCRVEADGVDMLDALPIEFSASTGEGGVEGELVVFESSGDIEGAEIAGKIVLTQGSVPDAEALLDGGAAGLIVVDPGKPRVWHLIYGPGKPLSGKIPMVTLGFGDAVDRWARRAQSQIATPKGAAAAQEELVENHSEEDIVNADIFNRPFLVSPAAERPLHRFTACE